MGREEVNTKKVRKLTSDIKTGTYSGRWIKNNTGS